MLEVRSEHQLEEKSQWIMKGFTTFYLGDFNDSVNGKLLLFVLSAFIFLVFILICLLMPRHLLRTNTILSRQKASCAVVCWYWAYWICYVSLLRFMVYV